MKKFYKVTKTIIPMVFSVEILFLGCNFMPQTQIGEESTAGKEDIQTETDDLKAAHCKNRRNGNDNYNGYYYDEYCYDDSCYNGYYDDYYYDDYGYCSDGSCYNGYYDDYYYDDYGYCSDGSCYNGYYDDYYYDDYGYCSDGSCYNGYYDDYSYGSDYYGNSNYYYDPYYGTTYSNQAGHNVGKHSYKFDLFGPLGSASELEGTTAVVSIFTDDDNGQWTAEDNKKKSNCCKYLDMACKWISDNAADYGCNADFVYDFNENADLYYETKVQYDMTIDSYLSDYVTWGYIEENIDSEAIMKNHNADNIIYMVYVDTPMSNDITSCTRNFYKGMKYPYEICYIYIHNCGYEEWPASYAHEMLHTFGAPDLYSAGDATYNYSVPQSLVNEYERKNSNNIMFTVYDLSNNYEPNYHTITNDFSEMLAYYVGITDRSSEREKWGMSESEHVQSRKEN